ncbi:hypothetical protein ACFPVX_17375 [Cohnella faecalis]|uniref:Uncharacterized protein n=1 Tax=Cohnella faecalis TaxID=2315694 RepID=A0A398CNM4_9BACL|nr:hypothetical protein [Cohnella faecalis]RIE01517.1 hypothetical protein D3H35_24500 [Cohnella faecalis]
MQTENILHNLAPLHIAYKSKDAADPSELTLVKTSKFGKRMPFSQSILEYIGSPTEIQVSVNENGIAISQGLPDGGTSFVLRKAGKKPCVYSSQLVDTIAALFNLNFDGKTSISFYEVTYLNDGKVPVAFIPITQSSDTASEEQEPDFTEASAPEVEDSEDEELGRTRESLGE